MAWNSSEDTMWEVFPRKNEIVKADKFINDADKYRYLVGRILTKYLAAFYLSVQMET